MTTATETHECSFPYDLPGGSFRPCQGCGKTYERAQAETMLAEAVKAMNATEPGGRLHGEYETVSDLRRGLVSSAATWQGHADRHYEGRAGSQAAADAYVGNLMAGCYSYTLAAVLGVAAGEYGEAAARRLAWVAATVMIDGDDDDLNADVAPEAAEPQPALTAADDPEAGTVPATQ